MDVYLEEKKMVLHTEAISLWKAAGSRLKLATKKKSSARMKIFVPTPETELKLYQTDFFQKPNRTEKIFPEPPNTRLDFPHLLKGALETQNCT